MADDGSVVREQYTAAWSDQTFWHTVGLTANTVLDYLRKSVFYDKSCLNERMRAQGLEHPTEDNREVGLRYIRVPSKHEPKLFIIKMQSVTMPNDIYTVKDIALYYVNNGVVYQAPNVHSLVIARMQNCADRVKRAFDILQRHVKFDPPGYSFRLDGSRDGEDDNEENENEAGSEAGNDEERQRKSKNAEEGGDGDDDEEKDPSINYNLVNYILMDMKTKSSSKKKRRVKY